MGARSFQGSAQGAERASPAKSMFAAWLNVVRAPVAVAPEGDKIMTIASEINGRSQRTHVPPNRSESEYFSSNITSAAALFKSRQFSSGTVAYSGTVAISFNSISLINSNLKK